MPDNESFMSRYKPTFDQEKDEWVLYVPQSSVSQNADGSFEVRLPVYAGRALAIGGNKLRNLRREYREWLLEQQEGKCAICGKGVQSDNPWNLDHQPPLAQIGSKFIDYERITQNRVIHGHCDPDQMAKKRT